VAVGAVRVAAVPGLRRRELPADGRARVRRLLGRGPRRARRGRPFAIVGAVVYLTLSASSTVGLVLLGLVAVLFALALVVLWALVQVPVVTYLRYYALLVLGDIEPAFDIIPERREAARGVGGPRVSLAWSGRCANIPYNCRSQRRTC